MKMKKNRICLLIIFLLFVTVCFCLDKKSNEEILSNETETIPKKNLNNLSMMLETESGSGEYTLETRSSWPTKEDGYIFNSTLSKCEKGSKLRWDDETNSVVFFGSVSDKCYVYFDIKPKVLLADLVKSQYTGVQGENNLYYHDSTLENGAGDNSYRYAGSSETTNNFVCFGSDEATCPDDNLYRIIGVFGDQVKLIKWDYTTTSLLGIDGDYACTCEELDDFIGGCTGSKGTNSMSVIGIFYWNNDGTTYGTNIWSASKLNTVNLNTNYINNIGSTWANKIATMTWKVGGNTWANIAVTTVSNSFKNEITNPVENINYRAKIGLMYVSDYGYAPSIEFWNKNIGTSGNINYGNFDLGYGNDDVKKENWMYMGLTEWTLTRCSDYSYRTYLVLDHGGINMGEVGNFEEVASARPVFYLNSDVTYISGDGTKSSPIIIS